MLLMKSPSLSGDTDDGDNDSDNMIYISERSLLAHDIENCWADDLPLVIDEVFLYDKGPK